MNSFEGHLFVHCFVYQCYPFAKNMNTINIICSNYKTVFIIFADVFFSSSFKDKEREKDIDDIVGWCGGCQYLHINDISIKSISIHVW